MFSAKGEVLVGLLKANLYGHPEAAREQLDAHCLLLATSTLQYQWLAG